MSSHSEIAAAWYCALRYADLPPDIVARTKQGLLNMLAVALATTMTEYGPPVRTTALELNGSGPAHLIGYGDATTPTAAAFVNATLVAALAYDESHPETLIHVYGTIASAALALAEARPCDGGEFVTAVAGAVELTCRIALVAPSAFHVHGLHPTGIIGAIGAAFLSARLLGLSQSQMVHAVGIAGNMASGIMQCVVDGTWSQMIDNGWAAQAGITAATLARNGFTGPAEVLEGPLGLFRSHVQDRSVALRFERIASALGTNWNTREIAIKPHPCGHVSLPFVDCMLSLHAAGLRASDVKRIVCPIAAWMVPVVCEPVAAKRRPATTWHARVSLPYTMAETLYFGRLDGSSYRPENLVNPDIVALTDRVEYRIDESASPGRHYKGWVRVETLDGRVLEEIDHEGGGADRPMSAADFDRKIADCIALARPARSVDAIRSAVERLDQAASVSELMRACA